MSVTARTKKCSGYSHPEIEVSFEPGTVLDNDVDWLLRGFEEEVAAGKRFKSGETMQIGWMLTKFEASHAGNLVLQEPDMHSMPIKFVNSISNTLLHLRTQKDVVESLGLGNELDFPWLQQSAIVCSHFSPVEGFIMERSEPVDSASGWFLGCSDPKHDHNELTNLKCVSLYEIARQLQPAAVKFLALPTGIFVDHRDRFPKFWRDETELNVLPGSFLDLSRSRA